MRLLSYNYQNSVVAMKMIKFSISFKFWSGWSVVKFWCPAVCSSPLSTLC